MENMNNVLMVHEITETMLNLDLSNFDCIVFDDGLYSQYKHYKHFLKFNIPLIFGISTEIVHEDLNIVQNEFISCREAHFQYFNFKNTSSYMTWEQIKEIHETENCIIAGHSHSHSKFEVPLIKLFNSLYNDTSKMLQTFKNHNIEINSFIYPYNKHHFLYEHILKTINNGSIKNFYGYGRFPIENLLI
jgi:hypothetical protein